MKIKPINIIVSHPRKQYVYELLRLFTQKKYTFTFYTSFWSFKSLLNFTAKFLPTTYATKVTKILNKRRDNTIPDGNVVAFSSLEILRLLSNKMRAYNFPAKAIYHLDCYFDKRVAKKIKDKQFDIFIGYEMACYESFKMAKSKGAITILDLAQIHYKSIDTLADNYECLYSLKKDIDLYTRINVLKQKEYELADYIFVLSDYARQSLIENNIPEQKIILTHLGVDIDIFKPRTTYPSSGPFKIIFVGTLFARKGIQLLLDALVELNKTDIELIVVGAQLPSTPTLKSDMYNFKLTHIPYATHVELNHLYQNADLFILPSYLDSFGMVVTEAMATGTPVIVTTNTGSADYVRLGGGKVIAIDSVEEIKNSILYYYSDRTRVQIDGIEAARISRIYSWDYYRLRIDTAIDKMLLKQSE